MPKSALQDWLEEGMRRWLLYPEPNHEANELRIGAAIAKHGSIVGAMRAGAL